VPAFDYAGTLLQDERVVVSADGEIASRSPLLSVGAVMLDLLIVVALGWVLWVTVDAEAAEVAAASGKGRPGVMVVEGLRPARAADIPVGTFTEPDGTRTREVAWQDRPAAVGDRLEGVRVGDRAWAPGVQLGLWDVLVVGTVSGVFVWRVVMLIRRA
jgi:hypothetical protein